MTMCYCGYYSTGRNDGNHPECDAEYDRRDREGLCLRCGQHDVRSGSAWCGGCNSFSFYLGYPGGSE